MTNSRLVRRIMVGYSLVNTIQGLNWSCNDEADYNMD